ncbi:MAG: hypothetical protein WA207_12385 [Candidatus Acidiferrum sp.]
MPITPANAMVCDGCGQTATPEHIARRLARLEWTTRYRPIHIGTLLLGAVSPIADDEFLYAGQFRGEAGRVLEAAGIAAAGKPAESVLSEFQRAGFFLTHLLECPLEAGGSGQPSCQMLMVARLSAIAARIRRSLKPKRVALISGQLAPMVAQFASAGFGCPLLLDGTNPFGLDAANSSGAIHKLRVALGSAAAAGS